MKPSLETLSGLLRAAEHNLRRADRHLKHIEALTEKHGYTLAEVRAFDEREKAGERENDRTSVEAV